MKRKKKTIYIIITLSNEVQTRNKRSLPNTQHKKGLIYIAQSSGGIRSGLFLFFPFKLLPSLACPQSFKVCKNPYWLILRQNQSNDIL